MLVWRACCYPQFLNSWRDSKPERENYGTAVDDYCGGGGDPDEPNTLYWDCLEEYECHLLRAVFLEEMERLEPAWVEMFEESDLKMDLEFAWSAVILTESQIGGRYGRGLIKTEAEKPWEGKVEGG